MWWIDEEYERAPFCCQERRLKRLVVVKSVGPICWPSIGTGRMINDNRSKVPADQQPVDAEGNSQVLI